MKKLAITLLGALFSVTAFGQDLLQCVDPDVVKGLLFGGRSDRQLEITATVPDALAGVEAPAGFTLVGTAIRERAPTATVAYRTARPSADAFAAFVATLAAAGWEQEQDEMAAMPSVFSLADGGTSFGTVCRDGARLLLRVLDIDDTRYTTINVLRAEDRPRACHAEDRQLASIRMSSALLTEGMPTLQFPPGTRSAAPDGTLSSGGGSSGPNYSTGVQVLSPDPAAALLDHFAPRMSEAGWKIDARWSGSFSTGARWTRTDDDGTPFWATIELVELTAGRYDVSYRQMSPR